MNTESAPPPAAQAQEEGINWNPQFFARVKHTHIAAFAESMAALLDAGIALNESLEIVEKQLRGDSPKLSDALADIRGSLQKSGSLLYPGFKRHEKIFGRQAVELIKAGEESGVLSDRSFPAIARSSTIAAESASKRWVAMIPVMVGVAGSVVVTYVITGVLVPVLMPLYLESKQELPLLTRGVIAVSEVTTSLAGNLALFTVVAALIAAIVALRRSERTRPYLDRLALKVPVYGTMQQSEAIAMLYSTHAIMQAAGASFVDSVQTAANTCPNRAIAQVYERAIPKIANGGFLYPEIDASKLFPQGSGTTVKIAEKTGKIDDMLSKMGDFYFRDAATKRTAFERWSEQVLIMALGGYVALLALALYMPLFGLYEVLARN